MLNKRLVTCMAYFNNARVLFDVGTDHAYLPIAAFTNNAIEYAYAIDNKKGPLLRALKNITEHGLEDVIETMLSDGLTDLTPDVDLVVIAGMGGKTIQTIVDGHVKAHVKRWIFQPNNAFERVRMLTHNNHLQIVAETVVEEDGYYYPIIVMAPGKQTLSEREIQFGPKLLKTKETSFKNMLKAELDYLQTLVTKIPDAAAKIKPLSRIQQIEEVLYERDED